MEEIWKDIKGYEGLYQISNYGFIKSLRDNHSNYREKILKQNRNSKRCKHLQVRLCNKTKEKSFLVHRLILETFVGPCPPGMECRHLDGNPQNNKLDNLKWGTSKENKNDSIKHKTAKIPDNSGMKSYKAKLNNWKVRIIIRLLEDGYLTQKEISEIFNISISTISNIKHKKRWKNVK